MILRNEVIYSVKNILSNYIDSTCYLTKGKKNKKREKRKSIDFETKIYVEGLWNIYRMKHPEIINIENAEEKFLKEILLNTEADIKGLLKDIEADVAVFSRAHAVASNWIENPITFKLKSLHLENLHRSMNELEKCFAINESDEKIAVEKVLSPETLHTICIYLEAKNYAGCLLYIAPITRALTQGQINSYTPAKGNTTIYFNEKYEYNLEELDEYFVSVKSLALQKI